MIERILPFTIPSRGFRHVRSPGFLSSLTRGGFLATLIALLVTLASTGIGHDRLPFHPTGLADVCETL